MPDDSFNSDLKRFSALCRWCGTIVDPVVAPIHPSCATEKEKWRTNGYPHQTRLPRIYRDLLNRQFDARLTGFLVELAAAGLCQATADHVADGQVADVANRV